MPLRILAEACAAVGVRLPPTCQTLADAELWLQGQAAITKGPVQKDAATKWIRAAREKAEQGKLGRAVSALGKVSWIPAAPTE
jgi:hypothetical protein